MSTGPKVSIVEETPNIVTFFEWFVCVHFIGFSWSVFTNKPICDVICVCGWVWRCHFLPKNDSHGAFASVQFPLYPTLLYYWWADVLHSLNEWEIWDMGLSFKGKSSALHRKSSGNIKNAIILINKRTYTNVKNLN